MTALLVGILAIAAGMAAGWYGKRKFGSSISTDIARLHDSIARLEATAKAALAKKKA